MESPDGRPLVGNDRYLGFCTDLMVKIAEKDGINSYVFVEVRDVKYGAYEQSNKTWNGMIGELIRGVC